MTLTVGNYSKSPRLQDRNGAAFSLGMSKGFDIDFTTSKTVDAQADTTTGTDVTAGWVLVTRNNKATTWPLTSLTNFSTYRIRMRYISTNGTSKWIVREGVPGAILQKPEKITVIRPQIGTLRVGQETDQGQHGVFRVPGSSGYEIKYCRGARDTNCQTKITTGQSAAGLTGLQGRSQYHIAVRARSSNGRSFDSPWSDWVGPIASRTNRLWMDTEDYTVIEGGSLSHPLTIVGARTPPVPAYVRYSNADPVLVTLPAGVNSLPVNIPEDNNENEPHRNFTLSLVEDLSYVYDAPNSRAINVTVGDNDPPIVAGVTVNVSVRTLQVSWNAPVGPATRYEVQYKKTTDTDWQTAASLTGRDSTTTDIVAEGGELYEVRVRAHDGQDGAGNGWGPWAIKEAGVRTDYVVGWGQTAITITEGDETAASLVIAKSVPTRMTATVTYGGDNLSDLKDGRVTTFSARRGQDLVVVLATPKTGDGNEGDETFTVTLNDGIGYAIDSNAELTVTIEDSDPPAAPAVTQTETDDAQYLEWTAPADGPIGRYQVQKLEIASVGASVTEADWAGTAPTNVAPPTATRHRLPIPDGKTYVFRVRAHDGQSVEAGGNGWGEWSRPTEAVFPRASRGSWEVRARDARPGKLRDGHPKYEYNFAPGQPQIAVVLRWDAPRIVTNRGDYAGSHAGTRVKEQPGSVTWSGVQYDTRSGLTYDVALAPSNNCPVGSARDFGETQRTRFRVAD
ncbi:MAG: fibronectin type III domain-containing protein, partial [Chloroflexi bacterium]|nr:fibronectin type III domain-containing protein [Chloroflexota bacterium]